MKATHIIFILTSIIYIEGSDEHTKHKLTDIPSRSESNRILNGTTVGNGEYAYIAEIYIRPFITNKLLRRHAMRSRGVLIAPQWVVTVAHPFDDVLNSIENRKNVSNLMWRFVPSNESLGFPYVRVAIIKEDSDHRVNFYEIYFPDRYDPRYVTDDAVDVALIKLEEPVPKHIASPPSKIDAYLLPDGNRMYPVVQDCWTVSEETAVTFPFHWSLYKMNVIIGNRQYCTALEKKLHPEVPQVTYNNAEYFCATSNDSVNPGARVCGKSDHGAAVMCGNRLLGLLSRRHDLGDCSIKNAGENAYGEYVYLGHRYVHGWLRGIVTGVIKPDTRKMYRSDESASGLVEASKTLTWLLTVISVAVALNTYY